MSGTPLNIQELNMRLISTFQELRNMPYIAGVGGDSADRTIITKIHYKLGGSSAIKLVSAEAWRTAQEYAEPREKVSQRIFEFESMFDKAILVDKPNGSQQWPDALLIYRFRGIAFEIKSSKNQKIAWNSGGGDRIPAKGIYIFNSRAPRAADVNTSETTFFLGEDIITEEEQLILEQADGANTDVASRFNRLLESKNSKWSLYARPMFNCGELMLTSPMRDFRENKVLEYLRDVNWDKSYPK